MKQVTLVSPKQLVGVNVEPPNAKQGEALVQIRRVGICGTDYHAFRGEQPFFQYPRVLGHELAGVVAEVSGESLGIEVGDTCAIEPYVNCGLCDACRAGLSNCCERLSVIGVHIDGGMREFLNVPMRLLHRSKKLNFDELALIETLGIGAHAVERAKVRTSDRVALVGAGPIGLAVAEFLRLLGVEMCILEMREERRHVARSLGFYAVEESPAGQFDVVFDATGSVKAMERSFDLVATGGRLIFVGLVKSHISFDDVAFHRREMTLLASRNSRGQFPRIIRLAEEGRLEPSRWITHRATLDELPLQFDTLCDNPGVLKAMIEVN
jgi:2-desacetyl-2-hydroxyethyl bacteriochlorophyllide A dehydrogenase